MLFKKKILHFYRNYNEYQILTGKDNSLHHLYTDPLSKARLTNKKV